MSLNNTGAMKTPIPSTAATSVSSSGLWSSVSAISDHRRQTRIKDLETQMFYGPGFDPPVNNALVPSIFNKLDAQCQERTRVLNNVLDKRRDVQERVITRSRDVQEKAHAKQTAKLKEDLRKICKRLPSFAKMYKNTDMALLEKQVKDSPVPYSRFNANLPDEHHYCFRYFEHHNPVRIARRVAEGIKKDVKRLEQTMENKTNIDDEGSAKEEIPVLVDGIVNPEEVQQGQTAYETSEPVAANKCDIELVNLTALTTRTSVKSDAITESMAPISRDLDKDELSAISLSPRG